MQDVSLGCGSGIWAKALTQAGYDVLGVLKFYNNCKELAFKSELFMDMENSNSVKPKSDLSQRKHKFSLSRSVLKIVVMTRQEAEGSYAEGKSFLGNFTFRNIVRFFCTVLLR